MTPTQIFTQENTISCTCDVFGRYSIIAENHIVLCERRDMITLRIGATPLDVKLKVTNLRRESHYAIVIATPV